MLVDLPISALAAKLGSKEISSEDLIHECYNRIEKFDKQVNSFITLLDKKEVLFRAKQIDQQRNNFSSSLAGIPYVMKDAYTTKDVRTTAASKILDSYIPPYSSTVHKKLEDAGAILLGKMNMDAWGHGASTENTDYPMTKNPWDHTRSAGGSGGGPAAAIASRFCVFGMGEDTGGSIRNPAAWNNITAVKVTYGRVSRYGAIAYASSLDTMGPTAKTAEDCAHILQVVAGRDPFDATTSPHPVPDYMRHIAQGMKGKRIAFPSAFFDDGLDSEIKEAIVKARDVFISLGAVIEEVTIPMLEYGSPVYYVLAPSETSSNLARYDGIRYGEGRNLFTKETKRRIMTGSYALSSGYYDAYYKKAQKVRSIFMKEYNALLGKYDAILSPETPMMPTKFGELIDDPIKNMMADLYNVTVSIVGLPSIALPCGFSTGRLPIGMQLVGRMFSEDELLKFGYAYQEVTDWHTKAPQL